MCTATRRPAATRSFEYLRIQRTPSGIVYLASPAGRDPTPFPLTTLEDRRVVFENPDHDFPQRITYWLDETGALHARVEGDVNGDTRTDEWVWQRTHAARAVIASRTSGGGALSRLAILIVWDGSHSRYQR